MNGPELMKALLAAAETNPYRLATSLKKPPLQSYVSKFMAGKVKEPRRDSLRPVAEHFDVPLEAFYDPILADQVAAERGFIVGAPPRPKLVEPMAEPSELAVALEVLLASLQDADKSIRIAVAPLLAAMAADPADGKNQSDLVLKLLVADRDKRDKLTQDRIREPHIYVEDLGVDLGDRNGRSNTDKAAGGRKK